MRRFDLARWMAGLALVALAGSQGTARAEHSAPAPAPTAVTPPRVDLNRLQVMGDAVTAPIHGGGSARLTVDPGLQHAATRLLARARPVGGAIVAADGRTGRVLAWASVGLGSAGILGTRAPTASLFKIVTTAALLELDGLHPATRVCYSGGTSGIERRHLDAPRGGDFQCHPFWQALGHSRNAVYAQMVTKHLMREELLEMGHRFGFGGQVPFDVPAPVGPFSVPYNDLAFARAATGFQDSQVSPLGALELAFVVADGGRRPRLRIVDSAGDYVAPPGLELGERVIESRTAANLRWMMEVTINQGTSVEAFTNENGQPYLRGVQAAGKTGTLQPDPNGPTTTWFVGFAPSRDPRLVVSVLLQNGRVWRRKANEVARDLFRAYFSARGSRGITAPFPDD
jgi:peptidoglycan glycosyltransferase